MSDEADAFSEVAAQQYDDIMSGDDLELADAVWDACELICNYPQVAANRSGTITTAAGLRRDYPVGQGRPHKVFWDAKTGRIEAIFAYP